MICALINDVIDILPGCAGQGADAVSSYTQVQFDDAPGLLNISSEGNVQMFSINVESG